MMSSKNICLCAFFSPIAMYQNLLGKITVNAKPNFLKEILVIDPFSSWKSHPLHTLDLNLRRIPEN